MIVMSDKIKKYRPILVASIVILLLSLPALKLNADEAQKHNYKPAGGYVLDEETAIKIAVAVWSPIYGKGKIENEKPYKAILRNGIRYVSGSLPKGWVGGVAEAEISKEDACIIRISHGK